MENYQGQIEYGGIMIQYSVFYVNRKTLEIAVLPDCKVVIKAPLSTNIKEIQKRIGKRARWILKQQAYFAQFMPRTPPNRYIGGETHLYLGRQYRLKIQQGIQDDVKLTRGFFWLTCKDTMNAEKVKKILDKWYLHKCKEKFTEGLEHCFQEFKRFGLEKPALHIRKMNKRWGSLSKQGTLTLNTDLIRAPRECIDYVITHELCHLKYHDHSSDFYQLLERIMPDWERRKHKLELALV
jgi:predicted metal-dependent hydrolase